MKQTFTDQIAQYLGESKVPLEDWVIIIPSERARQYIHRSLFRYFQKPIFAPQVHTINAWVQQLVPLAVPDKTRLLLMLYEVHRSYPGAEIDVSFDEFLNWGRMLLADFDEIERYLIDSKTLFRNLRDIKEIENWSFGEGRELTANQKKFLAFWERLPHYYHALKEKLSEQKAAMSGSIYRMIAEQPDLVFRNNPESHILFAGFNALSLAEMSIMRQLHTLGRGHIISDADEWYVRDEYHEAGMFQRRLLDYLQMKTLPGMRQGLNQQALHIELISCAQNTGQVQVASEILAASTKEQLNETLVLLADESLIVPLLQHIPKKVGKANITLGLPLRFSALRTWINLIFGIQEGIQRYQRVIVYYKDLLQLWNHPFLTGTLTSEEQTAIHEREIQIRTHNIIFQQVSRVRMAPIADQLLDHLYTPWENNWQKALEIIRQLNQLVYQNLPHNADFERAVIQRFDEQITGFHNAVNEGFPEMNLRSFKALFNQEWAAESIAYYGNPIEGLQIMGLLETRLLDFKRLIVLGMNEGKMPPGNQINSMIPMDLRSFVGLPVPRDKQGLFAHHFYRLLHHAEEVYCTWHQGAEGLRFTEKSRYLSQMELELSKQNPNVSFLKKDYTLTLAEKPVKQRKIVKNEALIQRLDELFEAGISPSLLKTYFKCSLDFYYKYVLKFGEQEEVEEELESASFGTLIHGVLEDFYRPFTPEGGNLSLKASDIDVMINHSEKRLEEAFTKHFNGDETAFKTGKNYLSFAVAVDLTKRFLRSERDYLKNNPNVQLEILALEYALQGSLELNIHGRPLKIKLRGYADRIDKLNGIIRIIDYKTGKVDAADVGGGLRFNGSDTEYLLDRCKKSKHFFQLLTYLYLYNSQPENRANQSAIISLVSYQENPFVLNTARDLSVEQLMELYPIVLQTILESIYDTQSVFSHTTNKQDGQYCAYCN